MSDETPPAPEIDLAFASTDDLVAELEKRFENLVIYGEINKPKDGWHWLMRRNGDIVRLYGAIEMRLLPMLEAEHDEMFFKPLREAQEGDDC